MSKEFETKKYECELCTAEFTYAGEFPPEQQKLCQSCKYALRLEGTELSNLL